MFGKAAISVLVLAAGAMVPMAPSASATAQSVPDCVQYAADEGDASIDIAFQACTQGSLLDCYRVFRDEYGRQLWALESCKLRDQ
ncbi:MULTISPECIES: hypothetical protein [Amycolatopsis]|uniref:Uncharacterized protein n=1 Tax=Amycolatopsis albidoflavus TaxID=102226 RepID=A0ABW5HRK5_9PSEU